MSRQKEKRRTRLARAERKRLKKAQRECERFRRLYEEVLGRRNAWYRRLLRRLTGGWLG